MNPVNSNAPVSIVIPTHNRAHYLPEAVRSALDQGELVGEVIVVDDASADNTAEVLRQFQGERLRVIRQEQSGPAAARDTGWRAARGEWIQFLDSDDALSPAAIKGLFQLAQREPGRIPFGQEDVHGEDLGQPPSLRGLAFAHRSGNLLRELCFYPAGTILSCLFPRTALEKVGGLRVGPEAALCEDFDFAVRLGLACEFAYLPQVTYRARMHADNRHRANQRLVWEQAVGCLLRHLSGRAGADWLRRRACAYFLGLVADEDLRQGQASLARANYFQCLRWWPIKVGAWKGLARSFASRPS